MRKCQRKSRFRKNAKSLALIKINGWGLSILFSSLYLLKIMSFSNFYIFVKTFPWKGFLPALPVGGEVGPPSALIRGPGGEMNETIQQTSQVKLRSCWNSAG